MRKLTRREIALLVIVAMAGIGYLWYASGRNAASMGAALGGDEAFTRLADTAPVVPLGLLEVEVTGYDQGGRDLFKYSKRPPSAAELEAQRRALEAAEAARRKAEDERNRLMAERAAQREDQTRPTPPPGPPPGPRPPSIGFKYIGYLGPKDNRIAVFQDGEELFLGRQGESLLDKFRIVEIRYETVVMGYTDPQFQDQSRELPMARR